MARKVQCSLHQRCERHYFLDTRRSESESTPYLLFIFSVFFFFCAQLVVFNILMMMIDANITIVRFFVGLDGAQHIAYQPVSSWRIEHLPSRCTVLPFVQYAQIFVSSSSHVSVCSLVCNSHPCTGTMALSVPDRVMLPSPVSPSQAIIYRTSERSLEKNILTLGSIDA